jgi:hypothetical protein
MAARLEGLARPNGVTISFNALPLNKKNEIEARVAEKDFKEVTSEIRGIGKTRLFQWIFNPKVAAGVTPEAHPVTASVDVAAVKS